MFAHPSCPPERPGSACQPAPGVVALIRFCSLVPRSHARSKVREAVHRRETRRPKATQTVIPERREGPAESRQGRPEAGIEVRNESSQARANEVARQGRKGLRQGRNEE